MMRTSELDMADLVYPADIDTFIDNVVWAIRSTYHTVLTSSPGPTRLGQGGTDRALQICTRSARQRCDPRGVGVGSGDRKSECDPPILPLVTGEVNPKDPFNSV